MLRGTSYVGQNFLPKTIGGKTVLNNNHKMKGHSFRMAPNEARLAYIESSEKPTNAEIQSMCLTGGRGAMRQMLVVGGWDKEALIATPVSRLDRNSVITGTYWLLQGVPKLLCVSARDLWPMCTDTNLSVVIELGDLSHYEFGDLSTTSTWISSETVMPKIKFVTGSVRREITPQQAGNFGIGTFIFRLHLLLEEKDNMRV